MKYFIQSIFLLSALLAVNGCNFNNRPYDTLMLRLKEDISTTDPAYIVDVDGSNIAAYLYNGLVKLDKSMQIVPDIAERWEISNDGLSYRFFIRTDVKFTTGEYCTAEHIKRSFMRILDPLICSPRSWIFEQVDGASDYIRGLTGEVTGFMVISPHIFQIQLKEPFAPFLSLLTMPNAFVGIPANTAPAYIIGTGPFYIEKWIRGDKLLLRQNPSYFEGAPHIEHILIRVIPEDFTAITEFETGMLDIMDIPSAEFEYFTRNTLWKDSVHSVELLNTYYLGFNCQKEPCSDVQFRRTVASGISTDKIIQYYFQNRVEKAVSPVPSALLKPYGIEVNNFNVDTSGTDTNMPPITLTFNSNSEMQAIAELIQYDLANIGIDITLEALEWTAFKEKVSAGNADIFLLSWWADYPDIENFLYPVFHSSNWGSAGNRARYKNNEFDAAVTQARSVSGHEMQSKLYQHALDIIMQDMPWRVLWHKKKFVVCQPWVKGFSLSPISWIDKGATLFLEKK